MLPLTQVPLPVHPIPPHCDHFGKVPPVTGALDVVELAVFVDVTRVVDVGLVVVEAGLVLVLEDAGLEVVDEADFVDEELLLTTTPPGPATEVVKEPLSM